VFINHNRFSASPHHFKVEKRRSRSQGTWQGSNKPALVMSHDQMLLHRGNPGQQTTSPQQAFPAVQYDRNASHGHPSLHVQSAYTAPPALSLQDPSWLAMQPAGYPPDFSLYNADQTGAPLFSADQRSSVTPMQGISPSSDCSQLYSGDRQS
jgi:hypothetical protein